MSSEPGLPLRVQGSSRFAFGATTAALITLASGGTAALVAHGTASVSTPTSLPGGLLAEAPGAAGPVVVDRAPGAPAPDPTARALQRALAQAPATGARRLVAPLVALPAAPPPAAAVPAVLPAVLPTVGPLPALPVPARPSPAAPSRAPSAAPTPTAAAAAASPADDKRDRGRGRGKGKGKGKGRHAR